MGPSVVPALRSAEPHEVADQLFAIYANGVILEHALELT